MGATTLFAQKTTDLQFVTINEDNVETGVVKDGAIIDATEETPLGITSGLALKNATGSAQKVVLKFELVELDNGSFSCCFGGQCNPYTELNTYYKPTLVYDGEYLMAKSFYICKANEIVDLNSHWEPKSKGKCVVKFTAYQGVVDEEISDSQWQAYNLVEGPSVTVDFLNGVPSSISNIENKEVDNNYYDLAGRKVAKPTKGIYVKNNKKVVVK